MDVAEYSLCHSSSEKLALIIMHSWFSEFPLGECSFPSSEQHSDGSSLRGCVLSGVTVMSKDGI